MSKYRFLELNNGEIIIQTRFLFFFWYDTYHSLQLHKHRHTFSNLESAKLRLEIDLKKEADSKVKKIHE